MQFINSKQAYPFALGIALSVLAIGVWQKVSYQTERYLPQTTPVVIEQDPPTTKIVKATTTEVGGQGALRIANLTDHPVRIVLQSKLDLLMSEPFNWDFVPSEGGDKGLQLSLPQKPLKVIKGDIIFAFATDGSRAYWGPIVVGESNAVVWQSDRREWSFIIKP